MPALLQVLASVAAPTTLITALLFYYGRLHAQGLTRYLRVQFTVLDLTAQDYLVRSADGLFVPLTLAMVAAIAALWAHRTFLSAVSARRRRAVVRALAPSAAVLGLVGVVMALFIALGGVETTRYPEVGGLSLSIGVALLAYAAHLIRSGRSARPDGTEQASQVGGTALAEWGAAFLLFGFGLFWAVNSYAVGVGTMRGQQIERELPSSADVTLYSEKSLDLQVPGVRETTCSPPGAGPEAAYRFRYEGLKLVLQSGGQYLFLPAGWSHADGVALVIPRTDALRLEFGPPGRGVRPPC